MVGAYPLDSNQHGNIWLCADKISTKVCRFKLHSTLGKASPHFSWYDKRTRIHELREFGCDIYTITSKANKLDNKTQ